MVDHTEICWNFGKPKVRPEQIWYICDDCGATHVPNVKLGPSDFTEVDNETGGSPRPGHFTRLRPSGAAQRKAAKARKEVEEKDKANAGGKN